MKRNKTELKANIEPGSLASTAEVIMHKDRQANVQEARAAAGKIASGMQLKGNQANLIANAFTSVLLSRSELAARAGLSFGGKRDMYQLCGYPAILRSAELGVMYERQDVAKRIVDAYPKAAWRNPPIITEDEDNESNTPFEQAWVSTVKTTKLYSYLCRADRLSNIGQYSVLLLGFDDGLELHKPVAMAKELSSVTKQKRKLLYMQPYGELDSQIMTWESDVKSPRYGLPVMYNVMVRMANNQSGFAQQVHWTRILHVVQDTLTSDVFGTPILKAVYNRLVNLDTILSGSTEMFWRGGWPGLSLEADATMDMSQTKDELQTEADNYMMGMSRLLRLQGVQAKQLSPNIADPASHVDIQFKAISGTTGIPVRILTGSEMGELASSQDKENWNARVAEYQMTHCEPDILRPLIERLILVGVLPCPTEVEEDGSPKIMVDWEDQGTLGEIEMADVSLKKTQAMAAYVGGGVDALMAPHNYLVEVLGYSKDKADAMLDEAEQRLGEVEEENIDKAGKRREDGFEPDGITPLQDPSIDTTGGPGQAAGTTGVMHPQGGPGKTVAKGKSEPADKKAKPKPKATITMKIHGGAGSGFFGHAGRPGERGGSSATGSGDTQYSVEPHQANAYASAHTAVYEMVKSINSHITDKNFKPERHTKAQNAVDDLAKAAFGHEALTNATSNMQSVLSKAAAVMKADNPKPLANFPKPDPELMKDAVKPETKSAPSGMSKASVEADKVAKLLKGDAVEDAVVMQPQGTQTERVNLILKLSSGNGKARAIQEYAQTPVRDLKCLSGIRVESEPVHGQANCSPSGKVTMGSTSVTGDFRHELGHAILFAYQGTALAARVNQLHNEAMSKVKANPKGLQEKLSHDFYETTYGVIGRRALDSVHEDFAEHYRGYHKAIYQQTVTKENPNALKIYRERFPGWAKLWDAHYTNGGQS